MTTQPERGIEEVKTWFEANYLDGDAVQEGQMLASSECLDALITQQQTHHQELQKAREEERKQIIDYIGFVHFREPNDKEPYHKYKQQESGANFLRKKILRQLSKDQSELDQPIS